jgi:type VI protein secretion system component VasF
MSLLKVLQGINDATTTINALTTLLNTAAVTGREPTNEEVAAALNKTADKIDAFEDQIAEARQGD